MKRNSIPLGIVIGIVLPVVAWLLLTGLFSLLDSYGLVSSKGFSMDFRERTTALLAIAANIIPFLRFSNAYEMKSMRGIIFPTVIFSMIWLMVYGLRLLAT